MDTERIIIYGKGSVLQKNASLINWKSIIAVVDMKAVPGEQFFGVPVIPPTEIVNLEFDYVAIGSEKFYEQIKGRLLGEFLVPKEKIISWKLLISPKYMFGDVSLDILRKYIKNNNILSVLDIGMLVIPEYLFSKEELSDIDLHIDGIGETIYPCYDLIYGTCYRTLGACKDKYDLALIWSEQDIGAVLNELRWKVKHIMIVLPYFKNQKKQGDLNQQIEQYGELKHFSTVDGQIWILDCTDMVKKDMDSPIYVVTHKKYGVIQDKPYIPICVGNAYKNDDFLSESVGDNISHLNIKINECTAIYWIWKNTCSPYVGINHYRRYFYNDDIMNSGNFLDSHHIHAIMQEYDMIVPMAVRSEFCTCMEIIQNSIDKDAFENGRTILRNIMLERQPAYVTVFDDVMNGHKGILLNMFVMKREIFNEYCQWLFSFLIEAAEKIEVEKYDAYSKRVIGFFAERMLTVWLTMHPYKMKELPVLLLG